MGDFILAKPLVRLVETSKVGEQIADECSNYGCAGFSAYVTICGKDRDAGDRQGGLNKANTDASLRQPPTPAR